MVTGDLAEQQKPLEGGDWVTSALYLRGISLVRRNNEWHHFDPFGTAGVITNGSAQVLSNNLVDLFGVVRYQQGSAETPWRLPSASFVEERLFSSGSRIFVEPLSSVHTVQRWSWRWPPFRIRPPFRTPPGFMWGACVVACGVALGDFIVNLRGPCAGQGDLAARVQCALCMTFKRGGGVSIAVDTCAGCICGLFSGFAAAVVCGIATHVTLQAICAGFSEPVPPPRYVPVPYPVPVPVPQPVEPDNLI